ncbi:GNAT family N-acetyltransferase [Marinomonas spartinae]|uniref:GNAT family N-acetyltransferase n=1 Tax=Marinomonas spartinae TaxID=1792290 RepID=UPI00082D8615|nr:GNAT family N-acetyltransferase [Marinomonas spartinae]MBJ7555535.1 GNAT family N-acetyltransferase [Marinomonas spartinae]
MESQFLSYRQISVEALPHLIGIMNNSEHMRYSVNLDSYDKCALYIKRFAEQWKTLGYSCWTITEKKTGQVIGWGGIVIDEDDPHWGPELIYYIAPEKSGLGYASELANFATSYATNVIGLSKIVAFAHPENVASNKILERVGFKLVRYLDDMSRNLYEFNAGT